MKCKIIPKHMLDGYDWEELINEWLEENPKVHINNIFIKENIT